MMIKSRFIQAEQKPGRSRIPNLRFQISDSKSQIQISNNFQFKISNLRSISWLNYCEKIVARNSAANRRDRRLRNEAAVPVRRTHDPEAKLQRKEFRPRKAARH